MNKLITSKIVILLSLIVATIATYISYTTHVILAYNDATSHLNTARRVIDNLTPGFVQFGSIWLPLLHILELPFVANFFLWQSGLAGAIVSGLSFIAACTFLYNLTVYITEKPLAGLFAVLVLFGNANLLYLQSTAMFEPLLLATELGAVYFLTRWVKERLLKYLILGAFFTMLSTVTRYDGWALFLVSCGFVLFISLLSRAKGKDGPFFIFATLAGFGIGLWFLYNQMIFGDALYFARSEYSAAAQQQQLLQHGALLTEHNLPLSFLTYGLATVLTNGIIMLITACLGLVIYLASSWKKLYFLGPLLLLVPLVFNIATLYLGQSVIWMPQLPPHFNTYFNVRYGILVLPAIAFFVGYLSSKHRIFYFLMFFAILGQGIFFFFPNTIPNKNYQVGIVTLRDTVSSVNKETYQSSGFLHAHYASGLILVSAASSDAFIFRSGIPLKNYITEGTGYYWRDSLRDPAKYATWLVFFPSRTDRVGKAMPSQQILKNNFRLAYHDQTYEIWEKSH